MLQNWRGSEAVWHLSVVMGSATPVQVCDIWVWLWFSGCGQYSTVPLRIPAAMTISAPSLTGPLRDTRLECEAELRCFPALLNLFFCHRTTLSLISLPWNCRVTHVWKRWAGAAECPALFPAPHSDSLIELSRTNNSLQLTATTILGTVITSCVKASSCWCLLFLGWAGGGRENLAPPGCE